MSASESSSESQSLESSFINFDIYPIHLRDSNKYKDLVKQAKQNLKKIGFCRLPEFITQPGLDEMKSKCNNIVKKGGVLKNQVGRSVNCYYTEKDKTLPNEHPINTEFKRCFGVIRDDMIGSNDVIRQVYNNQHLINFVSDVLEKDLYQSRDSYQALTVNVMGDNENLHWHFDCNACAITLGIQKPDQGGEFEFSPFIGRENYEAIQEIIHLSPSKHFQSDRNDRQSDVLTESEEGKKESLDSNKRQKMATSSSRNTSSPTHSQEPTTSTPKAPLDEFTTNEGMLVFFCGGQSLHRVKSVHGSKLRMVAALQYHTSDDAFDPPDMTERIYGVNPKEHVGPKPSVVSGQHIPTK